MSDTDYIPRHRGKYTVASWLADFEAKNRRASGVYDAHRALAVDGKAQGGHPMSDVRRAEVYLSDLVRIAPRAFSSADPIPEVVLTNTITGSEMSIVGEPFELRRLALALNDAADHAELKELAG